MLFKCMVINSNPQYFLGPQVKFRQLLLFESSSSALPGLCEHHIKEECTSGKHHNLKKI